MKTTILKQLSALCLSVFTLTGFAQCPAVTGLSVSYGANGSASLFATMSNTTMVSQSYFYWQANPSGNPASGNGMSTITYQFPANGNYTVCVNYIDSISMCSSYSCTPITITNMSTVACSAGFSSYTDSLCGTHFTNSSAGSSLTYNWYLLPAFTLFSTQQNPTVNLGNGTHQVALYTYSSGQFCDSAIGIVNVNCSTNTACSAAFTAVSNPGSCQTYFTNNSTGTNLTYQWYMMPGSVAVSTQQNPVLNLNNGNNTIALYVYSNGQFCDSMVSTINVSCSTFTSSCNANSQFSMFADTTHPGNYFAYNQSSGTGTLSYLWNFGDGSSSTQAYPFHQYTSPGQYIVCLTVTATSGSLTCTDTYCDSSSVHRIASGFLMNSFQALPQTPTALKEQQLAASLSVYPNPVENELTIEVQWSQTESLTFTMTDALGKIVVKNTLTSSKTIVNTADLDKGIYFLTVSGGDGKAVKTTKLIK